jgi:hypothetical protein
VLGPTSTATSFAPYPAGLPRVERAHWGLSNGGLEEVTEFRDHVAQNLKMTADESRLVLAIVGYGVWEAVLPDPPER